MKCPLRVLNSNLSEDEQECTEYDCAWYEPEEQRCAILDITYMLARIKMKI